MKSVHLLSMVHSASTFCFWFLLAAAYLNTGIILMNQGKTEEARRTFLKCSEIPDENLKDPHAHKSSVTSCLYNLGKLYHEQGHYEVCPPLPALLL